MQKRFLLWPWGLRGTFMVLQALLETSTQGESHTRAQWLLGTKPPKLLKQG